MQMESVSLLECGLCVCMCVYSVTVIAVLCSWHLGAVFFCLKYLMDLIAEVLPVYGSCILLLKRKKMHLPRLGIG